MHETPLFMRVPENPVVRNNAAWTLLKSMEKHRFSTIFSGFCGYLRRKCRFLPVFCHFCTVFDGKTSQRCCGWVVSGGRKAPSV